MASYSMSRSFFDTEQKQEENRLNKEAQSKNTEDQYKEIEKRELYHYYYNMLQVYPSLIHPIIQIQSKKRYISAAFWNYTSTPINFVITLFTGLTAGQAGSNSSYLTGNTVFIMLFVCFILSTINIFFKLKEKAELNFIAAKKYEGFNSDIQNIDLMPTITNEDLSNKLTEYKRVKKQVDEFNTLEKIENVNYFTEFLYFIVQKYKSHRKLKLLYKHAAIKGSKVYEQKENILKDLVLNGVISQNDLEIIEANLEEIQENINNNNGDKYGLLSSFFKSDTNNLNKYTNSENNIHTTPPHQPQSLTQPPTTQRPEPYYPSLKTRNDYNSIDDNNSLEDKSTIDDNCTVGSYYKDSDNIVILIKDNENNIDDYKDDYDSILDEKYSSIEEKDKDFNKVQIIRKHLYFDANNNSNSYKMRK